MAGLREKLPRKTIVQALKGETTERRALATQAIGRIIRSAKLDPDDRILAAKLLDHLSKDICEEVRRALAITLRCSPNLPRSVANRLIQDIDSIAVPILSDSPVITDEDLIATLRSRAAAKVRAIATREHLSETVSGAVISFGDGPAVAALAANDGAMISKTDAARLFKLANHDDLIREAALRREDFPADLAASLIERQIEAVGDRIGEVPDKTTMMQSVAQRSFASYAAQDWPADRLSDYVDALLQNGCLDEAFIARAAGQGDWRFVQIALARLSGISVAKAGLMVFDPTPSTLRAICRVAGLGRSATALLSVSAQAFRDMELSSSPVSRRTFQTKMLERISSHPDAIIHEPDWLDWLDDGLSLRVA